MGKLKEITLFFKCLFMYLINSNEYNQNIQRVIKKFKNDPQNWDRYTSYVIHEVHWWEYFHNIFIKNWDKKSSIQLVFWESGPSIEVERSQLPHPNYAFFGLEKYIIGNKDKYLLEVYKLCNKENKYSRKNKPTRRSILENISEQGYLIIDLFPTHGFKLNKNYRNECLHIFETYSKNKLQNIKEEIIKFQDDPKFESTVLIPKDLNNEFFTNLREKKEIIKKLFNIKYLQIRYY